MNDDIIKVTLDRLQHLQRWNATAIATLTVIAMLSLYEVGVQAWTVRALVISQLGLTLWTIWVTENHSQRLNDLPSPEEKE